jgi:putative iron-dependent peroxidase
MSLSQPGILSQIAPAGRYVTVSVVPGAPARALVDRLRRLRVDDTLVVGLGEPLARAVAAAIPGLRTFPALSGPGCSVPSTQGAVLLHTRGDDHGGTLHAMRRALELLGDHVRIEEDLAGFRHDTGRDLSGYEDGTENPKGAAATAAAIVSGAGAGLDGSSFVAVQRWLHDLASLERLDDRARDALIGRDRATNAELADAPVHAHIRRSQQESFEPPAFMVRRSMPYGTTREHGLYFVAYVAALATFERMLTRMAGIDDGIVDGLFAFSRPVSGGYYWCPPLDGNELDLRLLGA